MHQRTFLASLFVALALATGCASVHDLTPSIRPDDLGWSSLDGCRVIEVTAGDTPLAYDRHETITGTWVDLDHPADVATRLFVDVIELPSTYVEGDAAEGYLVTSGHPSHWPASGYGELAGLGYEATGSLTPPGGFPVYGSDSSVLLAPTGWTFRVRVCDVEGDAYPVCGDDVDYPCPYTGHGGTIPGGGIGPLWCVCIPGCAVDTDCPVPSSGDVAPSCVEGMCWLACDTTSTCPDGQACTPWPVAPGAGCMTPP